MMRTLAFLVLGLSSCWCGEEFAEVESPAAYVDPVIGTGGFGFNHGSCFVGAAAPHGLVKLGPDTTGKFGTLGFLHYSGYWAGDDTIQGFSHLHLHGTGLSDYGVLTVMPTDLFDATRIRPAGYQSTFAKASEAAGPGSYAVTLDRGAIRAELSATGRVGHHRYTFGPSGGHVIFDLAHALDGGSIRDAEVALVPGEQRFRGRLRSMGQMSSGFGGYDVWFEGRAKRAWRSQKTWAEGEAPHDALAQSGTHVGFVLGFDAGEPVELQIGISLVSAAGAAGNLAGEAPGWDFDGQKAATRGVWDSLLRTIRVWGGSEEDRRKFYTALYHAFLMPTITMDYDETYRWGGEVRHAENFHFMSDMSLWDTYRTLHPLYALIAPESARDAFLSLRAMADISGSFPKWPIATGEAGTMIGASAEIVVADGYLRHAYVVGGAEAYTKLREAALAPEAPGGRGGRNEVMAYDAAGGFVPARVGGSVSLTTEYALEDFALGNLARQLSANADADRLLARSLGWRKLFDPATGFLRGHNEDGSIPAGEFNPLQWHRDYVEANAWHSTWAAPHDVEGLVALFGGVDPFVIKLEEFFQKGREEVENTPPDDLLASALPRDHYWHSNEPDIHAAYLFAQAGRPELTQKWVRWIMDALYKVSADGLAGNDDGGTLSSWYVWSALGLYPIPGSDRYILGAPLFPRMEVTTQAFTLRIDSPDASTDNLFVQAMELDDEELKGPELRHGQLDIGDFHQLTFEMGPTPP